MRFFGQFIVFVMFLAATSVFSVAQAEPKPWILGWWESHWVNQDFEPYLESAKHPHNSQWNDSNWRPDDWTQQRESDLAVLRGFYRADVLNDQYTEDEIPVLEVGPGFYMLGGQDKRRVAEMVDSVYQITTNKQYGMFLLYDWKTDEAIGSYTQYGLQLQ